jgi:hypothetical protein
MKSFNFYYATQSDDRLYILWDNIHNVDGQTIFPEDEQIQEFIDTLGVEFEEFVKIESDYSVASYFGYNNCIIYGNN